MSKLYSNVFSNAGQGNGNGNTFQNFNKAGCWQMYNSLNSVICLNKRESIAIWLQNDLRNTRAKWQSQRAVFFLHGS